MTTMTSREFNQDAGRAKRATMNGPVFITDRGEPAHVLLTIGDYKKLTGPRHNLAEMLACPECAQSDFEPRKLNDMLFKVEDLS